ncbi:MAG TPA: Mov34/MPN/PAD-1 family protein [Dehalococcoidia bacterium]|nr:Mov34/MPN/PAD-1 family protein [Dehalococcoidia bacterium]
MAGLPAPIQVSPALLEQVYREARRAFPYECCGWLAGPREGPAVEQLRPCVNAQETGGHPTAAQRGAESAYVLSGPDLLALNRSLESPQPARIIYHSHPNGQAYFSPTDRQVARSPWGDGPAYPVQQLVVGIDARRVVEAALFAWSDEAGDFVEIARYRGAEM